MDGYAIAKETRFEPYAQVNAPGPSRGSLHARLRCGPV